MNDILKSETKPTHEEIAARAYELWEKGGRKSDQDKKCWQQAEAELCASRRAGPPPPSAVSATVTETFIPKPAGTRIRTRSR